MRKLLCCFLLSAIAMFAEVTGKWSGTGSGETPDGNHTITVNLELKQSGNAVTGTVGSGESGDRFSIESGAMDGDVLTFKVSPDEHTYEVKLTVKEDKMSGEAVTTQGNTTVKIKLELKRDS